jgi:hypothetical protein|tara:strand:+ start:928 stop:1158 length:231 start_codon:yes stop_codon:yes gene_type:complete
MFVTNKIISEIAQDLQTDFENGDLHTKSNIHQIAKLVQSELADRQLPTRKSLAIVIAKISLTLWHETVFQTKKTLA